MDYNLSDKTSFFVSYQYGQDAAPSQGNGAHIYWTPVNSIPYLGGGLISSSFSKSIAGYFTHVFSPTLTNEFIASWGFGNFPVGPPKASAAYKTTLGFDCDNDGKLDIVTVTDSTVDTYLHGGELMVTLYHQDTP